MNETETVYDVSKLIEEYCQENGLPIFDKNSFYSAFFSSTELGPGPAPAAFFSSTVLPNS